MSKTAIVIGAGIVGLATARALALRDFQVTVIDRSHKSVGASIRNFGMIWPIGQPDGPLFERAVISRNIWQSICDEADIWYDNAGSIHTAYKRDEWQVLSEFYDLSGQQRDCKLLTADQVLQQSKYIVTDQLIGALYSPNEMIVDPRESIDKIAALLQEKYAVQFIWGQAITQINFPTVYASKQSFSADQIYICSGSDFETLYPEQYTNLAITKCKLQMMRLAAPANNMRIGAALCGALSLLHYKSFAIAPSLHLLRSRLDAELPEYNKWHIHVMAAQNQSGQITIGDSHEYGLTHDPFDRNYINQLILNYLKAFARFDLALIETWNGIYAKLTNGDPHVIVEVEPGVTIINGLGGAGMTLSFGLCEQLIATAFDPKTN